MPKQIATYHLAPNFSTGPVPLGPVDLGSILSSLDDIDVLNERSYTAIPQAETYCHHKTGFTAKRSEMRKGEYGIWAQFVGQMGIGGELRWSHESTDEDAYTFKRLDTIYFTPTPAYLKASMNASDVADWVDGANFAPVYMVTGLKIARGPSVNMKKGKTREFSGQLGLQNPAGVPLNVGPKLILSDGRQSEEGWEESDDFIFGIRVKKLMYKRAWLSSKRGDLKSLDHYKGATLLDDDDSESEEEEDVVEIDMEGEWDGREEVQEVDDGTETVWITPKRNKT
jgi:hypothetical protein